MKRIFQGKRMLQLWQFLQPIFSVIVGLGLGLLITKMAGEDPFHVLQILIKSAFGSQYDFGMTLFYTTPLILTGLSVAFAFNVGLFNIGAEGQLTLGALAAAAVGITFPNLSPPWAPLFATFAAFAAGALWGAIPGWLRAKRGSHEVINTIMLNFIAAGIASWVTLYLLRSDDAQGAESSLIGMGYLIQQFPFFDGAPVSFALFIALGAALVCWVFLWKTVLGYEIRAIGQNEIAAKAAGIPVAQLRILTMAIAGGLAGLVGVGEVLGNVGRFRIGFSAGFGFTGIAVALLGRNKPLGVVAAAMLFGALHKGTSDLDLETENVTRDLSLILQAMVILCVSAQRVWDYLNDRVKRKIGVSA